MDSPPDSRLFAMCLLSALTAFVVWVLFGSAYNGGVILFIAIAVFAVLMFIDGYRQTA
ncbi:hypothetical protein G6M89_08635 [Natronolimnobius sp. AArcel1]|uniref:hypothetical protein n=1 Tax=Natronolimnobius sp. AArcel1 TaxID=1679093 RepID=UPI0013EAEB13|nr:hypothetical protein [Natronolimnobius sp. AArcel1]NGM69074.1 hypothetical protein [Natronolimnobius sp. AArcel1]